MAKVVISLTMSLDGFIAGPNDDFDHPLGTRDGMKLFDWYSSGRRPGEDGDPRFKPKGRNKEVVDEMFATTGATLSGRRTYEIAGGWEGTHPINAIPVVVLTHEAPKNVPKGKSEFTFTDDLGKAVRVAKEAAGDKDVGVAGASIAQQCIRAGLVDEIYVHIAPMLLGEGVRLFEHLGDDSIKLEFVNAIATPEATHLRYRVQQQGSSR
jgi:dihydrofolate reductase